MDIKCIKESLYEKPYPVGCPVVASVTITTLRTSPNLLKCRERLSLVAAKWTCVWISKRLSQTENSTKYMNQ